MIMLVAGSPDSRALEVEKVSKKKAISTKQKYWKLLKEKVITKRNIKGITKNY